MKKERIGAYPWPFGESNERIGLPLSLSGQVIRIVESTPLKEGQSRIDRGNNEQRQGNERLRLFEWHPIAPKSPVVGALLLCLGVLSACLAMYNWFALGRLGMLMLFWMLTVVLFHLGFYEILADARLPFPWLEKLLGHLVYSQVMVSPFKSGWYALGGLSLEMVFERLIADLCDGQAVQVCLTPDRLDPAAFDVEGDALGLLGGVAGLRGEAYPLPDLAGRPTSTAAMPVLPVGSQCTLGVLSRDSEEGRTRRCHEGVSR
jgi:hypothetical protein